jgi:hypothetical protein
MQNYTFKKGDRVVCINNNAWNDKSAHDFVLRKYMIYEVLDVIVFYNRQSIDIGARFNDSTKQTKQFYNNEPMPYPGVHWASSNRFLLFEESEVEIYNKLLLNDLKDEMEQAIEQEDFETAIKLRDIIKNDGLFKED